MDVHSWGLRQFQMLWWQRGHVVHLIWSDQMHYMSSWLCDKVPVLICGTCNMCQIKQGAFYKRIWFILTAFVTSVSIAFVQALRWDELMAPCHRHSKQTHKWSRCRKTLCMRSRSITCGGKMFVKPYFGAKSSNFFIRFYGWGAVFMSHWPLKVHLCL